MARLLKCYGSCNEKHEKQFLINHNGRNYCKKCYEEVVKSQEDMKTLYSLIKRHYNVTFPTSMHLSQIKRAKDNGYSYEDLIKAMNYCVDKLNMKFNPKMGFGWVTNKIEEAKEYYKQEYERQNQVNNIFDSSLFKVESVKIKKIDKTNTYRESKKIKWEDIL